MPTLRRFRRLVAIGIHRVLLVVGVLGLVYVPVPLARDGLAAAVPVFLAAAVAIGLSVELARSLDVQRTVRRTAARLAARELATAATERSTAGGSQSVAQPPPPKPEPSPLPGRDVTSGRVLAGFGTDQLPVIGFMIVNMSEDEIRQAMQELAEHQLVSASFKPLIIMDQPHFDPARRYGYPAELIIPADAWEGTQAERSSYLRARLQSLRQSYGCVGVITVPPFGLGDVGRAQIDILAADWSLRHKVPLPGTRTRRKRPASAATPNTRSLESQSLQLEAPAFRPGK